MTIIWTDGDLHLESHRLNLTITDAAGLNFSGVTNVDLGGNVVAAMISPLEIPNNDNTQAIGCFEIRDQTGGVISYGEAITGFQVRLVKQIGTAGATITIWQILIWIRK